jgi:hypothetical protein
LLITEGIAQIRLGRYADAERAATERAGLPPNRFSEADPEDDRSRARVMRAHAVAKQGRNDEARKLVQPEIEYYRRAQQHGGKGLSFQRDLAYALYVNAIAQPGDPAGRAKKDANLAEAAQLIAGLSSEARQLMELREISGLIAAARAREG